ncbi:peptidoglycan DD-metalloendopeptidase family protein [Rhodophyticola porphyridii]|uniref:M23ase beta-sheet core domain-containing protein n=1 Tax=Rhodophyticola porphyridii TaxID=1852017 RepID=A0A3L9Y1K7_9RHOB|nr:peptidoglycan DD-metalloendopeptidase family protein [Rhodophyticola porphyridii]RMA42342.1 hypothetical protein D9R08_09550 [Rhodophyticola porphyridii]
MPTTIFADAFRHPLGNGLTTPLNDGDGFYVAFGFNEPNPELAGSFHLGADWNGEGGGDTDLGDPVFSVANGTVVSVVADQGSATTGFGNYIVLRHDFEEPRLIGGQSVSHVYSLYAHLDTVASMTIGQEISIGQQIGTLGSSGYSEAAHLHLEITLGNTLPTSDDGYNPAGAPSDWVDPVAFVENFESYAPAVASKFVLQGFQYTFDPALGITSFSGPANLELGFGTTDPVVSYSITGFELSGLPVVEFGGDPLVSGVVNGGLSIEDASIGVGRILSGGATYDFLNVFFSATGQQYIFPFTHHGLPEKMGAAEAEAFFDGITYLGQIPDGEWFAPNQVIQLPVFSDGLLQEIDFGVDFGAPQHEVELTDDLVRLGVVFSSDLPGGVIWFGADPTIGSYSHVFGNGWSETGSALDDSIRIDFVNPIDTSPVFATEFSVRAFDDGGDGDVFTLTAYDGNDNVLDSVSVGPDAFSSPGQTLSVYGDNISYVTLLATGSLFFDDMSYRLRQDRIDNNEPTPPTEGYAFLQSDLFVNEGTRLQFELARADSGTSETLYFSTLSATASFDEGDYGLPGGAQPVNIPVTFAAGQSTATVTLDILQDGVVDGGERFRAILQADPNDPVTTYLARSEYLTISEFPITTTDTVREGTDTTASLSAAAWISGRIDPEPIQGDGVASDGVAGFIDRDWYEVALAGGGVFRFEAQNLSLSTGIVAMRLYDAFGNSVAGTFVEGAAPSFDFDTAGLFGGTANYYLAISAGDANNDDFRLATGNYAVRYTPLIAEAGPTDTVLEGTDTKSTLFEGQWRSGKIDAEPQAGDGVESDGLGGFVDKDWYAVSLTEGRVYTFEAESMDLSTGQVTITLFDASGQPVPGMSVTGATPQMQFDTAALPAGGGQFFLAVEAGDSGDGARLGATGDFRVRVSDFGPSAEAEGTPSGNFTDDIIVKLAKLADAAYFESTAPAEALGFKPIDPGISGLENSFVNVDVAEGLLENNLHFYEADVDGERSLFFAFSGTQDFKWDIALQAGSWDTLYEAQAGIIDAVLTWANGATLRGEDAFQNVFLTGHSLGGILVEEYFASSQFSSSPLAQGAYGVTFGSPGSPRNAIDDSRLINFVNIADPVAALHSDDLFGFVFDENETVDAAKLKTEVLLAGIDDPFSTVSSLANQLIGQPLSREGNTVVMADTENTVFGLDPIGATHGRPVYNSNIQKLTDFYRFEPRSAADELAFWQGQEGTYALETWDTLEFAFIVAQTFTTEFIDTFSPLFSVPRVVVGLSEATFGAVETITSSAISFGSNLLDEVTTTASEIWDRVEGTAEALNEFSVTGSENIQVLFSDLGEGVQDILFRDGSAIIDLDVNGDGVIDYSTRIEGEYDLNAFLWHAGPGGTVVLHAPNAQLAVTEAADQVVGDDNANTINALGGDDLVFGREGLDVIDGGPGLDAIYGMGGSDVLLGGLGNDTLDGGSGDDGLNGQSGNDVLRGGLDNDNLAGSSGDDELYGEDGDDFLTGGLGADLVDGGPGRDQASYKFSSEGVAIDLAAGTASGGTAAGDVLLGIEDLLGSAHGDVLTGDGFENRFYGQGGNDHLIGGLGPDRLFGEDGDDTLEGGEDDDRLDGGAGADEIDGGLGTDQLTYRNSALGVVVNLATGLGSAGDAAGDVLTGIEDIVGSSQGDEIIGDGGDNRFYTLSGADIVSGGDGVDRIKSGDGDDQLFGDGDGDWFDGGPGGDSFDGGAGLDMVSYQGSASGVTVDLLANTASGGDAAGDSFISIENVAGSAFDDAITGDGADNRFYGLNGNDTLHGGEGVDRIGAGDGDDEIYGEGGNDWLEGGPGADLLDGGDGIDMAVYEGSSAAVQIDLQAGTATGGEAAGDTLISIENLAGSGFGDVLTGNGVANRLIGGGGNDTISGGDGDDKIFGGSGDNDLSGGAGADYFVGGSGANSFDGGADEDVVSYGFSGVGVEVDLGTGTGAAGAAGDSFVFIENVQGTAFDDVLTGDGADNRLFGEGGNDTLSGGAGIDRLYGGAGADEINGGADNDWFLGGTGADRFVFDPNWGRDIIADFEDGIDVMDLGSTGLSFGDLTITPDGSRTFVSDANGNSIRLEGILATDLTDADFSFV